MTTLLLRRGTAAAWTGANPILAAGEVGFETDTYLLKIGDGTTVWNSLPYFPATVATHDNDEHDRAETGDLAAVAAAADAGVSDEVPNADHVHAHGTGYAGGHTDAGSDGSDHDVLDHADANTTPSPANGDVLTWDSTPGEWVAAAPAAGGGGGLVMVWSSKLTIASGTQSRRIYIPYDCTIIDVYFSLPEANTGTTIIDVHKNGTTIFTTQSNRPECTTDFVSNHTASPEVDDLLQDDYLECFIDQKGGASGRVQVYIVAIPA